MKIIKRGNKGKFPKRMKCIMCKTIFEIDECDVKLDNLDPRETVEEYCPCPECGKWCYL